MGKRQSWCKDEIKRALEAVRESEILDAMDLEFFYVQEKQRLNFWLQRKRKKQLMEAEVAENLRLWSSGLIINFVDFAIVLEEMWEAVRELHQRPPNGEDDSSTSPLPSKPSLSL